MKKIIYCLMVVALLALNGCDESAFLKEEPRADIYSENLLVDQQGFQSMITALQGLMRKEYCRHTSIPIALNAVFAMDWYFVSREKLADEEKYYPPSGIDIETPIQIVSSGPDSEWASLMQAFFAAIIFIYRPPIFCPTRRS